MLQGFQRIALRFAGRFPTHDLLFCCRKKDSDRLFSLSSLVRPFPSYFFKREITPIEEDEIKERQEGQEGQEEKKGQEEKEEKEEEKQDGQSTS